MSNSQILALKIGQDDFPYFENPPIVETVLSVQYDRLPLGSVHFGLYWQTIRERYPKWEEQSPLLPQVEQVTGPGAQILRLEFQQRTPRLWFVNTDQTEMIQVQNDRFIKNWRKIEGQAYPRYGAVIKPAFEDDYQRFAAFLTRERLGNIKINQCEVTYVNHIVSGDVWSRWDEIDEIFTFCKRCDISAPHLGATENLGVQLRFPILDTAEQWIGRLHVDIQPALTAIDGKPMYVMQLTARGMVLEGYDFLDIGHWCVVKMFEQLTTPKMHRVWKRKAT